MKCSQHSGKSLKEPESIDIAKVIVGKPSDERLMFHEITLCLMRNFRDITQNVGVDILNDLLDWYMVGALKAKHQMSPEDWNDWIELGATFDTTGTCKVDAYTFLMNIPAMGKYKQFLSSKLNV